MPKDIQRKKYQSPMVYDIGGPNLNVVGVSVLMCSTGASGLPESCLTGAPFGTFECEAGDRVGASCGTGTYVGGSKTCGVGSKASSYCDAGKWGGACDNGSPG